MKLILDDGRELNVTLSEEITEQLIKELEPKLRIVLEE